MIKTFQRTAIRAAAGTVGGLLFAPRAGTKQEKN